MVNQVSGMGLTLLLHAHSINNFWFVCSPCSAVPMGFLQSTFSLLIGTGCGIYIAQNYDVPNIKKLMRSLVGKAKEVEESYKKTGNSKNKDNE